MIRAEWTRVTGPLQEPITVAEAKAQARITHTHEDGLLASYVRCAREAAEDYMGRAIFTQTWKIVLGQFPEVVWLPRAAPLQSVTSVEYYDAAGALQTLASTYYVVDTTSRPGRVVRAPDQSWPTTQDDRGSGVVIVTYVAGWSSLAAIPERIKQGIRLYVTAMDADRDGLSEYAGQARQAAEALWSDRVTWLDPEGW